jgi:hypothetical protein
LTVDTSAWSGEGAFTGELVRALQAMGAIEFLKVEEAPATRAESGYAFISNEVYVSFARRTHVVRKRLWRIIPVARTIREPAMSLADLAGMLAVQAGIGEADYADDTMIQYMRAERVVPPYQTRGHKQVEMVRIYEAGAAV